MNPNGLGSEPELHLLLAKDSFEEPLWRSLFRELDDFFFPKKLPPLKLESKPEPVREIWGFYSNWEMGVAGAFGFYGLLAIALVVSACGGTTRGRGGRRETDCDPGGSG